mmetsp:Transcript_21245/g.46107  ORF Transcript_21245/g.46107 Transcript_21245/m.46107 type:complete len:872 (-) Transcript_21245:196-2811(-)
MNDRGLPSICEQTHGRKYGPPNKNDNQEEDGTSQEQLDNDNDHHAPQQQQRQLLFHQPSDSFGEWSMEHAPLDDHNDDIDDDDESSTSQQQQQSQSQQSQQPPIVDMVLEIPPQLHPAVSAGMKRISSAYFSIGGGSTATGSFQTHPQQHHNHHNHHNNESWVDLLSLLDPPPQEEQQDSQSPQHPDHIPQQQQQQPRSSSSSNGGGDTVASHASSSASGHYYFASTTPSVAGGGDCCNSIMGGGDNNNKNGTTTKTPPQPQEDDLLYHDILMTVFGFLDLPSLAAFSETARRPNFEVFYYLQLQLQRALLQQPPPSPTAGSSSPNGTDATTTTTTRQGSTPTTSVGSTSTSSSSSSSSSSLLSLSVHGTSRVARLAQHEPATADAVVQGYLASNTSLQQMPLSYSLSYLRHVLLRQYNIFPESSSSHSTTTTTVTTTTTDARLMSGAALLVALIGAVTMSSSSSGNADGGGMMTSLPTVDELLPNMLFRVGFVGSLMSAAARRSYNQSRQQQRQQHQQGENDTSYSTMTGSMQSMMNRLLRAAYGDDDEEQQAPLHQRRERTTRAFRGTHATNQALSPEPLLPNPYDHLPSEQPDENSIRAANGTAATTSTDDTTNQNNTAEDKDSLEPCGEHALTQRETVESPPCKKTPTGCVGAYRRAISKATDRIVELVKEDRRTNYKSLSDEEQRLLGTALLDACSSDDQLESVVEFVDRGIDVEDFYVASDGTETSALHAAAFHGSFAILEYLCQGLDDGVMASSSSTRRRYRDGGLCNVNLRDSNGWTALHFAAGTNCTRSIQILVRHGADLSVEAANGYTPYQWAVRLQNTDVANELLQLMQHQKTLKHDATWPSPTRFLLSLASGRTARVST